MKAGKWEKKIFAGHEVSNKNLGIIGMGRVGSIVATRAQGLRMNVMVYDPFVTQEFADDHGIELVELDEIYSRADYITVHTPLLKETRGMINDDAFAKMKDGVMILNCARGGIVDEKALLNALNSGKVAGAALDVFETEPPQDRSLIEHANVICTPHLGASTHEAQENVAVAVAEQIVDYLNNGVIRNAINAPSVPQETLAKVKPYIDLAERMGSFMGKFISGRVNKVSITFSGEAAANDTKPVTIAGIKGFLSAVMSDVNYVNAPIIMKERGINVVESTSSKNQVFSNMIEVTLDVEGETRYLAGSVFKSDDLRFVQIDNYPIEVIAAGHMLVIYNEDKPGTVGNVGMILGQAGINIGSLFLGRDKQNGTAIIIIDIDTEVPDSALQGLRELPNVISVKEVAL